MCVHQRLSRFQDPGLRITPWPRRVLTTESGLEVIRLFLPCDFLPCKVHLPFNKSFFLETSLYWHLSHLGSAALLALLSAHLVPGEAAGSWVLRQE